MFKEERKIRNNRVCIIRKCLKLALPFFVFNTTILFSQSNTESKIKADSIFKLSNKNLKKGNYDAALKNIEESLAIYKIIDNNRGIGNCFRKIAVVFYYQGNYTKALSNFEESTLYYTKSDHKKGIASSYNNIGAIYYYLGNYPKALDFYRKALELQEKLNNKLQIAATTKNIGSIYLELNDYKSAKNHFQEAKNIYIKSQNSKQLIQVLSGLGEMYLRELNYSQALNHLEEALELAISTKEIRREIEVLFKLGELYSDKKEYYKAFKYYKTSLLKSEQSKNLLYESNSLVAIGTLESKLGKILTSLKKCKKGLKIAEKLKVISTQQEACECLYNSYKKGNNVNLALKYFEQMHLLKDSLNLKQTSNKMLNMKFEKEMLLDSIANVEKERKLKLAHDKEVQRQEKQRNILLISGVFILVIAGALWSRLNYTKKAKAILQVEKDRSEHLLHNILPEEVADELKEKGFVKAQDFETASILFTDFKSFTATASKLTPQELVEEINECFKAFDGIIEYYGIEKIKTIGDAYMAAGGLPKPDVNAVKKTILAALEMQEFIKERKKKNYSNNKPAFDMRVGIHVGPIVAGIVGVKKFQYDVWGDTVNTASRMESNGAIEKVNISQNTYEIVKDEKDLQFEYRGKIDVKGKGKLSMYFVSVC
ncbi:adenylate/guanylate cyclase domain-containing protein [uncultured Tenacibaculum sp.]|uniref:adenylate/guanylate cyclase domain-containing protein n=1 Tax=uncultured Tenacibaculum sp. TaxID=174713 RepID=UPI00262D587F|nr:adenylate/guanylate cyclase domain-containing protein [uncultured Tenacibaculum sp.]